MTRYSDESDFMSDLEAGRIKVLVPLDGSPRAEGALAYLSALTDVGPVEAYLVAVVDDTEDQDAERLAAQRNLLDAYLKERGAHLADGVTIRNTTVAQGRPAAAILEEADRVGAGLLVISSHSRSGIQRWRLGSVADKIVRGAVCDTLVLGGEVDPAKAAIRRIMVPLDGSELAEQALPRATSLASKLGAELHLVRVVSAVSMASTDATGMGYASPELLQAIIEEGEVYIERMKQETKASNALSMIGMPAEALSTYAEQHAIDLVVMTSHGRGGLLRTALGSVTDRLLGEKAPVLVVQGK